MAFGGGNFVTTTTIDKIPGAYINIKSTQIGNDLNSDRGIATIPIRTDYGPEGIIEMTADGFKTNCAEIFGRDYSDPKMQDLRELFRHAKKAYLYRLNAGGAKATCMLFDAKYSGSRGNDLSFLVKASVDDPGKFDVYTKLDEKIVDKQTVKTAAELQDNDYAISKHASNELVDNTGALFKGGTDGTETVGSHKAYLDAIESYSFNTMGLPVSADMTSGAEIIGVYKAFCKRLRDSHGAKFQLVTFDTAADYEGVISVTNTADNAKKYALVYWVTGVEAGLDVSETADAMIYDGEYSINTNYTQAKLIEFKNTGKFVFHRTGDDVRVLEDINTLVTFTDEKGKIFSDNKTMRIVDFWATQISGLFNTKYLGKVPNDEAGRSALWSDVVQLGKDLQQKRAIENFNDEDVQIARGDDKNAVILSAKLYITGTMNYLFVTTEIE